MLETLKYCPVCGSEKHEHYLDVLGHDDGAYHLCECGAAFLTPRMDDEELAEFYSSGRYRDVVDSRDDTNQDARKQHADRAAYLVELLKKSKFNSHLDIGCASGELLRAVKKAHPEVFSLGVDSDPTMIAEDFTVVKTLEEVEVDGVTSREFDLITIIQTLEHINNPVRMMNMIYDRLSTNGAVMIEVPNRRADLVAYIPPQHVIAYDEKSLRRLLSGFTIKTLAFHGHPYISPLDRSILVVATK
jgi:SAM-dependent methyltransferase